MRKWMQDKLKRRKKTKEEAAPTQAPLQPAYFEPAEAPAAESKPVTVENPRPVETPSADADPEREQPEARGEASSGAAGNAVRPQRRRRGRGGRGRRRPGQVAATAAAPGGDAAPSVPTTSGRASSSAAQPNKAAQPSKGVVVLAIGLPGSGKSSWFKRNNITPLSSDMIRALLFDNPEEQRFQDLVFSNIRSMLRARLVAKRPMNYVDATNLTPHERDSWIKLAKDYGYEAQALYFDVPLELCLERNQRRQRAVSEDIMRKMAAKLKAPAFEEGFSKITVVRVKQKE